MKTSISAVILTKNEELNIKECLTQIDFCSEIIVVDDDSTDKTTEIAKSLGAKVFKRSMNMDYSAQSNFGMEKAKGDWVLFIDADERIGLALKNEILKVVEQNNANISGFVFRRIDNMWGKALFHGESGASRVTRLVRKGSGKWIRRVHPTFEINGDVATLQNPIQHYPHQNLREFLSSINRWSHWHAIANNEEGKRSYLFKIVLFPIGHFIKNYIFRLGILDGMRGFVYAVFMSFHSFLSWSDLFLLQRTEVKTENKRLR